jgi:hypothetical protein
VSRKIAVSKGKEDNMSDYSRVYGGLICLGTILVGAIFILGIWYQNYWALAIPVAAGFLTILSLGFWVGWTIMTIKVESPTPPAETKSEEE